MPPIEQLPLNFDFRPAMRGEDFLVANCNREAIAWLDRFPQWPSPFLVIYGAPGCGKTHLCEVFHQATGASALNLVADPFQTMNGAKVGILENLDGQAFDETALFHLYNHAKENGAFILITAQTPPAQWDVSLRDLKSRLGAVCVAEIGQPDDALMEAVLVKLFADRQLQVDREVLSFILIRMERSFQTARELVQVIDREALAQKRKITIPFVRQFLT